MSLRSKNPRSSAVEAIAAKLSMPRVQVSIILAITAIAAFLCSAILLRIGVTSMAVRYPIAVVAGYFMFLVLLRIWIWWQNEESSSSDLIVDGDIIMLPSDIGIADIGSGAAKDFAFGGGGDFAGGGAGGDWADTSVPVPAAVGFSSNPAPVASASSSSSGLPDVDVDLDDGVALLLVGLVLVLVFSSLIYVVWIAPILLAELMIDAAVVGSLYKPVKNIDRRHWLRTALRKTGVPALIVLLLFFVAGLIMQAAEPDAFTIGQFLNAVL